ncbi:MAG TPA: KH domain-containing protein [Bacilli bacterium]|nr:KH domain-containing protein [Bacilli bacterium]
MNYEKAIHAIIDPIVEEPDLIFIKTNESEDGKDLSIIIATEKNDIARLIGKHGTIANAIREVISVAGKVDSRRVHIKFESFNEEKED